MVSLVKDGTVTSPASPLELHLSSLQPSESPLLTPLSIQRIGSQIEIIHFKRDVSMATWLKRDIGMATWLFMDNDGMRHSSRNLKEVKWANLRDIDMIESWVDYKEVYTTDVIGIQSSCVMCI